MAEFDDADRYDFCGYVSATAVNLASVIVCYANAMGLDKPPKEWQEHPYIAAEVVGKLLKRHIDFPLHRGFKTFLDPIDHSMLSLAAVNADLRYRLINATLKELGIDYEL